jgi:hypothetical protein
MAEPQQTSLLVVLVAAVLLEQVAMVRHKIQRVQSVRTVPATAAVAAAAVTIQGAVVMAQQE